jgi:hypothetical protein
MPEVIVYETSNIFVYDDLISIVLNTAPNLTEIDAEIEVTESDNLITITQ